MIIRRVILYGRCEKQKIELFGSNGYIYITLNHVYLSLKQLDTTLKTDITLFKLIIVVPQAVKRE